MKQLLFILGYFFLISIGCNNQSANTQDITGDLYYTWFSDGSFYGQPDFVYKNYKKIRDSIGLEQLRKENPESTARIELLEKNGLIKSPFIYLKTDTDSILTIYMSKADYEPFKKFTYQQLIDENKKVRIDLKTKELSTNIHLCKKVISMEKVDGTTLQQEKKFKIVDYR